MTTYNNPLSPLERYRNNIPAALADALQVYLYIQKIRDYTEALKMVAFNRDVTYNTVALHCTTGISTNNYKVNAKRSRILMTDKQLLMNQLIKRFPRHEHCILEVIESR